MNWKPIFYKPSRPVKVHASKDGNKTICGFSLRHWQETDEYVTCTRCRRGLKWKMVNCIDCKHVSTHSLKEPCKSCWQNPEYPKVKKNFEPRNRGLKWKMRPKDEHLREWLYIEALHLINPPRGIERLKWKMHQKIRQILIFLSKTLRLWLYLTIAAALLFGFMLEILTDLQEQKAYRHYIYIRARGPVLKVILLSPERDKSNNH